ncbi:MAG TPA: HAMP domain-containing sensor histidine kinase [Actinomycetaceae bacterium]|nr:HAMP domain-containing sensor histidine kinase [Actinomycetaceae bacterium]
MIRRWWNGVPLAGRLTAAVVGLLSLGLIAGTTAMVVFLQSRLVDQVDDQLTTTAETISSVVLERLARDDAESRLLPTDHYLLIRDVNYGQVEWVADSTLATFGRPDLTNYEFPLATRDNQQPATVPNRDDGAPWRVITIATRASISPVPTGTMTIALPLQTVDSTLAQFLQRVLLVDLLVIALGALIGTIAVTRSMRPLREIEEVAGRIAAGDLTQRVPQTLPPSTEVGSLASSLNIMLTQIERAFAHRKASERRMRRFVSDASHELRTPLATVRGYGELFRLGGIPDDQLPHAMGRIESEATRMSGLVNDLLTLARLDEERAMSFGEVDLVVLAGDAAADLRALDRTRRVAVVGLASEHLEPVIAWADTDQLRQVFTNLVGNVVQHTPAGTSVELAVGLEHGRAVVEVRDHGPGVPAIDLHKVFGRFYRVDVSRSRDSGGTGLGLAIVAAIVAAHSGETQALVTPGGGLTVRVSLPTPPPEEARKGAGSAQGRRSGVRLGRNATRAPHVGGTGDAAVE